MSTGSERPAVYIQLPLTVVVILRSQNRSRQREVLMYQRYLLLWSVIVMVFSVPVFIFSVGIINIEENFNSLISVLFGILLIVFAINPWASGLCLKLSLENN